MVEESKVVDDLAKKIASLYSEAQSGFSSEANERHLLSCWQIGERIVEVEQKGAVRSSYGAKLFDALSAKFSSQGLRGLSARCLRDMRRFHIEVARDEVLFDLSWSQYRLLLSIPDRSERDRLARQAIRDRLPVSRLNRLIKTGRSSVSQGKPALRRPTGALWRYEVEDKAALGENRPGLLLNLGFRVRRLVDGVRVRGLEPGDVVQARFADRSVEFENLSSTDERSRYVYAARVDRVVDGDTILAHVDLGFCVSMEMRLRLRGVNAPDPGEDGAENARRFVVRRLRRGDLVAIRSYKHDPFDRYVADVFYDPDRSSPAARIFESGRFLNDELLQKGLASDYAP